MYRRPPLPVASVDARPGDPPEATARQLPRRGRSSPLPGRWWRRAPGSRPARSRRHPWRSRSHSSRPQTTGSETRVAPTGHIPAQARYVSSMPSPNPQMAGYFRVPDPPSGTHARAGPQLARRHVPGVVAHSAEYVAGTSTLGSGTTLRGRCKEGRLKPMFRSRGPRGGNPYAARPRPTGPPTARTTRAGVRHRPVWRRPGRNRSPGRRTRSGTRPRSAPGAR